MELLVLRGLQVRLVAQVHQVHQERQDRLVVVVPLVPQVRLVVVARVGVQVLLAVRVLLEVVEHQVRVLLGVADF
ncbi:MAG: hypothetical protein KKF27_21715 [Gammaproteobacteria bacterium]|nr:hypothetical protein [Gammaproteobacteria bacterium]MBU2685868.1 hypothetical protein [Gammaproteobacteria bacterium]